MKDVNLYSKYNQPYNGEYYAYFNSACGFQHTEYVGMSKEMLVKIAKRLTINYSKTKKLDLEFFGTRRLLFLEHLLLGYSSVSKLVVTEILAVYLWEEIFKLIKENEYEIKAGDISNLAYVPFYCDIHYVIRNEDNGISIERVYEKFDNKINFIPQTPINFCKEFNIEAYGYDNFKDMFHNISTEFELWLNRDEDQAKRYYRKGFYNVAKLIQKSIESL